jgi:RNA recognition motif-containing protein
VLWFLAVSFSLTHSLLLCVCVCVCVHLSLCLSSVYLTLYRNLPYNIKGDELYDIFGKYGPIRQMRVYVSSCLATNAHCQMSTLLTAHRLPMSLVRLSLSFPPPPPGPLSLSPPCLLALCPLPPPARPYSGTQNNTKGQAYVVYEDIYDAKNACEHLSGFNVRDRYMVVLYFDPEKHGGIKKKARDIAAEREELEKLKQKHGVDASE